MRLEFISALLTEWRIKRHRALSAGALPVPYSVESRDTHSGNVLSNAAHLTNNSVVDRGGRVKPARGQKWAGRDRRPGTDSGHLSAARSSASGLRPSASSKAETETGTPPAGQPGDFSPESRHRRGHGQGGDEGRRDASRGGS